MFTSRIALCLSLASGSAGIAAAAPMAPVSKKGQRIHAKKGGDVSPADLAALASADPEAAAKAAETLGANVSAAAHDALLDALALGLSPDVAILAIRALVHHRAPPDVASLVRYANHINPSVRNAALAALAAYPDPIAQQMIVHRLGDHVLIVRAAAAAAAAKAKVRRAIDPMLVLLARGEEASAHALAAIADPELARRIADQLGQVPDPTLALCLGEILRRADFGPETARVEVVRAIGKIQDPAAVHALADYLDQSPKTPPRPSRDEAKSIVDARGGK